MVKIERRVQLVQYGMLDAAEGVPVVDYGDAHFEAFGDPL